MKALVLTWEFPPFISGGLGIACYGLIKALLGTGVQVDMMLPTAENVYFPLMTAGDADTLPLECFDAESTLSSDIKTYSNLHERLSRVGLSARPESYITPGFDYKKFSEWTFHTRLKASRYKAGKWATFLNGEEDLFKKVQEFTTRVLGNAHRLSFDVIHAHDWLTYPAGIMLSHLTGKPLVAHIHATEFDRSGGPGDERIHKIEYNGLIDADRVIAVSNFTARMIIDRYRIPTSKIRVVHNAHTFPSFDEQKRCKLFKDPLVLFLGRVTIQKGPDYFLEVAQRVLATHPNVRFVVAGSGDMLSGIVRRSAAKRLKDRFLFTGFLNREQVEQILAATDIFVLPSVSEPFGIVPLEAMAFGAATIISKQSGVAEVVKNAIAVDFWDIDKTTETIVNLLKKPEEREALARAGRLEVSAIEWKRAAEEVHAVYKDVVCST